MAEQKGYKSFAYDPDGNKVDVEIRGGMTYDTGGNRIGEGYTVETQGGIYKMQGGQGVKVDGHNVKQPVQVQPQATPQPTLQQTTIAAPTPQVNRTDELNKLEAISRGLSDNYFMTQKTQADKLLAQKLTDLQKAYDAAIAEGDISVREAERQFNEQKAELEKVAYQQTEATRAYGNEMGIQNSQQMMGLQQGDNARMNSLNNQNAITRNNRINDIRDRINAITKAKDLDIAMANAEHGYNLMGAAGQAEQMHAERLYGTRQEDYTAYRNQDFAQQNMYQNHLYDVDKMGIQQQYTLDQMMVQQGYSKELQNLVHNNDLAKMAVNYGYDISKMDKEQVNVLERMNVENNNAIERMGLQHGFDLEKIGVEFANQLKAINTQAGHAAALAAAGREHDAEMWEKQNEEKRDWYTFQLKEDMHQRTLDYNWNLEQQLKGVQPGTREYDLITKQAEREFQEQTKKDINSMITSYTLDSILNDPLFGKELEKPKMGISSFIPGIGLPIQLSKDMQYADDVKAQSELYNKFNALYGNTQGTINEYMTQPGSDSFSSAIKRYINK